MSKFCIIRGNQLFINASSMAANVKHDELVAESISDSDTVLIERFLRTRDQSAFAQLVCRHTPVVFGVCRRVLHDSNDIDDAFQATFLILVRDMKRVRRRASLASWLYGVAYRLSLRLARTRKRRRETVLMDDNCIDEDTLNELSNQHDQQLLDDELNLMPERYRQPLVLRYLTGKSSSEVATELGTTVGTVDGLLKRGRDELRKRLVRRGVTLGATLAAVQCAPQAAQAAMIGSLIDATIQAGMAWNIGSQSLPIDLASSQAVELAGKEIITMTAAAKTTIATGLTVGTLIAGLGGAALLSTPQGGNAEAAGILSTVSIVREIGNQVEMAAITADPEIKPDPAQTDIPANSEGTNGGKNKPSRQKWDVKAIGERRQFIETALANDAECNFEDISLSDAIRFIKEQFHIQIILDHAALEENGIATDTKVTLATQETSLKTMLRLLLDPLHLDSIVKEEYLLITTEDVASKTLETRVYKTARLPNIESALLAAMIQTVIAPGEWNPQNLGIKADAPGAAFHQAVQDGGTPVSVTVFRNQAHPRDRMTTADLTKPQQGRYQLCQFGVGMGGGGMGGGRPATGIDPLKGSIHVTDTTLVIRATQRIHEEIAELLDQLEERHRQENESNSPSF